MDKVEQADSDERPSVEINNVLGVIGGGKYGSVSV